MRNKSTTAWKILDKCQHFNKYGTVGSLGECREKTFTLNISKIFMRDIRYWLGICLIRIFAFIHFFRVVTRVDVVHRTIYVRKYYLNSLT